MLQARQVAQVDVLVGGGISGVAVQKREGHTQAAQQRHSTVDIGLGAHAGGEDQRLASGGSGFEQLVIGEVGGGDLEDPDRVLIRWRGSRGN